MVAGELVIDPRRSLELLETVRCILAAATDGNIEFNVPAIADRTGLTVEAVQRVFSSPVYYGLLQQEALQLISHSLLRGVRAMDKIVHAGGITRNSDKIAAHRAIVHTYQAVTFKPHAEKPPDDDDLDRWAQQWLSDTPKNP